MTPLAAKNRPQSLKNFVGQNHLIGKNTPIANMLATGKILSMVWWGPSGVGKTTLAKIIANTTQSDFINLSAVLSSTKELREVIAGAQISKNLKRETIVFIDEIHHFNKLQQDILLPHIENGLITLIGATTENPSFELNNAILSRVSIFIFEKLNYAELKIILNNIIQLNPKQQDILINNANGDARKLLNMIEQIKLNKPKNIQDFIATNMPNFDKGGDIYYQQLSALHKSVRGSSPDGALYWFARLINAGCNPKIISRRLLAIASEDIGLADPRALTITLNAWDIYHRVGSKEGNRAIAQALVYCAIAPKSNALYLAFNQVLTETKNDNAPVPKHLCNATTNLMQQQGFGKNYRYAHNEKNGIATGQKYFPEKQEERQYYQPTNRGLEIKINEKLNKIRGEK